MPGTYTQGAVKSGSYPSEFRDAGANMMVKKVTIQAVASASLLASMFLPAGAAIANVFLDSTTAFTGATATIKCGTSAGGADVFGATDLKAAARATPVFTAPQLVVAGDIPVTPGQPDTQLFFQLDQTTPTAVGTCVISVGYTMKP